MNKAYNRCLFTHVHPAVGRIVDNLPGSRANNIYSPGSDKLTDVQFYRSTSFQSGSRVIRENEKKRLFNVREGSD